MYIYNVKLSTNKKSFTLAEVLITLVVIGAVAALTIPLLMTGHKKAEYSAKLKKIYNIMNEAVKMAEADFDLPAYKWANNANDGETLFNTYLKDYIKFTKAESGGRMGSENSRSYSVYLDDGSILELMPGGLTLTTNSCITKAQNDGASGYEHIFNV